MKLLKYKFSLAALSLVLLIALTAFFGLNFLGAEAKSTATASNVLKTSGDNVSLVATQRTVTSDGGTDENFYATFRFVNGGEEDGGKSYGYYSNKLAFNWVEKTTDGGEDKVSAAMFNFEFGFESVDFERFVITLESQQYVKTKDGKTSNYILVFPADEDSVYVLVTDDKDATADDIADADKLPLDKDHIKIEFKEKGQGEYLAEIFNYGDTRVSDYNTENTNRLRYTFKNIGGNYSKAVTSGSSTVYPLIFENEFKEDASAEAASVVVLYNLNGQDLAAESGVLDTETLYFSLNPIADTQPPVLCLENDLTFFTLNSKVDFDYAVIDVLRTSAGGKINYYVLTVGQAAEGADFDYLDKSLFKEATDEDLLISDGDAYLPMAADLEGSAFEAKYGADGNETDGSFKPDMLVKVYVNIYDSSSSSYKEEADIFIDWYLPERYTVEINGTGFIAVAEDSLGATFNYNGTGEGEDAKSWDTLVEEYQAEVDKAAEGLEAGKKSYFYLPSCESLFSDNATSYCDLKISVYYYGREENNNSKLATSDLYINVKTGGTYTFTVYATDSAGNDMYYFDDDGELVEFSTGDIWDMFDDKEGLYKKLPWFTFNVSSTGLKFEEDEDDNSGLQTTGYVGTSYSSVSFTLNSDDCDLSYRLFYFNRDVYFNDTGIAYSYEEFIAVKDELFNDAETRKYFTEIISVDAMEETDEEYEQFSPYEWSNSSTSFTPQEAGFYYILASATDDKYVSSPVTSSLAVVVSEAADTLKGESDWLKNNVTSVILLSVAALALIGIILLLVIKPKNKEDVDVRFEKKNEKKNDKKNK